MLVENACFTYLEAKSKRVRANTLEGYESAIRVHILPRFGGRELESLTHDEVQAWVDGFELPGAAAKAYKTLRQVVRWCLARQLNVNTTTGLEPLGTVISNDGLEAVSW